MRVATPPLGPHCRPRLPLSRATRSSRARVGEAACRLTALALVLLAGGCGRDGITFLHPHGPVAAIQRHWLFEIIGWMAIVVVPVFILVPAFAWRYRRRNTKADYRPDWSFSWPLEFVIWGILIAIVAALAYIIIEHETRFNPYTELASSQKPLEVQVVGLNWKWLFIYPEQHIATVGVLALPQGRPISFSMTSDATIQSFFIPALGSQIYAMAGMVTKLRLLADRPGELLGENTQFNGTGFMKDSFTVSVMSPAAFAAWLDGQRANGRSLDDAAYRKLSKDGSMAAAKSNFAVQPDGLLSFGTVAPDLFRSVVAKYNPADMHATMSAQR